MHHHDTIGQNRFMLYKHDTFYLFAKTQTTEVITCLNLMKHIFFFIACYQPTLHQTALSGIANGLIMGKKCPQNDWKIKHKHQQGNA